MDILSDIRMQYNGPSGAGNALSAAPNRTTPRDQRSSTGHGLGQSTHVTISDEALQKMGLQKESQSTGKSQSVSSENELSSEELKEISELKNRDREVRAHEMAHVMAGAGLVRKGASYQYEMGPDGIRYAVSGEVSIDTSEVQDDPSATIRKMEQVKRAALAPAEPSAQDRSVAAAAAQQEVLARQELNQQAIEES